MTSIYNELCNIAKIKPLTQCVALENFSSTAMLAKQPLEQRITAALQVFLELVDGAADSISHIDKTLIDFYISVIDHNINQQLDTLLHHPQFKQLESLWRGLYSLVNKIDFKSNIKLEILDATKQDLQDDFDDSIDLTHSTLYQNIYVQEYDTPGGEPIAAMIGNYEFTANHTDIKLLQSIAHVAMATHCPFLAHSGPAFFFKPSMDEVMRIDDLETYMERAEYLQWNAFRETEAARYIGLTVPKLLLRLPYGRDNPTRYFNYTENVFGETAEKYLWGSATWAFAANLADSFKNNGWLVNIRGPEAGGKVNELLIHQFDIGFGLFTKIPTEVIIPETRELELANQGFIPLSFYKNSDYACFFSANSLQKPENTLNTLDLANSRINARLPYIFLTSRIAHYLKVLQREHVGSNITRQELQHQLNTWLQSLVTKMQQPDPALIALHPLREATIEVFENLENPGYFKIKISVMPHFQIEGVDVRLILVSQLPTTENGIRSLDLSYRRK